LAFLGVSLLHQGTGFEPMLSALNVSRPPWKMSLLSGVDVKITGKLEMWANAQPDGRPAEHRWQPLFNAAKFG